MFNFIQGIIRSVLSNGTDDVSVETVGAAKALAVKMYGSLALTHDLEYHTDVSLTTLSDKEVLIYDAALTVWKNHALVSGDIPNFQASVSGNADVAANTAARHSHSNKAQLDLVTDGAHDIRTDNPHGVTKTQVGLPAVPNLDTTDAVAKAHTQGTDAMLADGTANEVSAADLRAHLDSAAIHFLMNAIDHLVLLNRGSNTHAQIDAFIASKGAANGLAPLGADSKVPAANLPGFVDDVLEFADLASFPVTGEAGKIYVAVSPSGKCYRWSGSTYIEISPSEVTSVNGYTGPVTLTKADIGLPDVGNFLQAAASHTHPISDLVSGILGIPNGGTGANTANGALSNLSPLLSKGDLLTRNASAHTRFPVGANGRVLRADSAQNEGLLWGFDKRDIVLHFGSNTVAYFQNSSTTAAVAGRFIFRGTDVLGVPVAMKATGNNGNSGSGRLWAVLIYDITNAATICSANSGNLTDAILDLGALANLPTGEAIFEIRLSRSGGNNGNVQLSSFIMEF